MLKHLQWSCSLSSGPLGRKEYWLKLMRPQKWVRETELAALRCLLRGRSGAEKRQLPVPQPAGLARCRQAASRTSLALLPRAGQIISPSCHVGSKSISLAAPWTRGRSEERSWWAANGERAAMTKTASLAGGWHGPKTRKEENQREKGPEHPEVTESQATHAKSPHQK